MLLFFAATTLFADTIIMKGGEEIKGLVVDEYIDRITVSTVEGEKDILRKGIDRIEYDAPEQNFMQLGRSYDAKGWHDKAAFYYKKAMEINPDLKEAREAYLASHAKMWREEEAMARKELERQSMVMDWWRKTGKKGGSPGKDKASLLKDTLGISLVEKGGIFAIDEVKPYSSAASAGIKEGDLVVGIWGRLTRYSKMADILNELVGPKYSEVRVLVEKEIFIPINKRDKDLYKELGILLGFEYEGLMVKDVVAGKRGEAAGLKKGDLVTAIEGNITRYLPLDSIIALVNSARDAENVVFTIRRKLNLRRVGG